MKILVVNQDQEINSVLRSVFDQDDHIRLSARNMKEAKTMFSRHEPDLVLVGSHLNDADGYQCVQSLNNTDTKRIVPIVILNTNKTSLDYKRFMDCGACDFIENPLSETGIRAKLLGLEKIRQHYRHIEDMQSRSHHEVMMAKHMFDTVISRSPKDVHCLSHWSVSAGNFSGDMLIYERSPNNDLFVLMADFTGHGLSAAIGALPTSDAFFAMVKKGLGLGQIAAEINKKLNSLLPVGHFCAASIVKICAQKENLEIWIGGQPGLWILQDSGNQKIEIESFHLPLGVLSEQEFSPVTQSLSLHKVDHIVLFSDGLLEAQNAFGECFGTDGIYSSIQVALGNKKHLVEQVKNGLLSFLDGLEPHDDVSLLSLSING